MQALANVALPLHADAMKECIVTGANRGIGLELCRQLIDRGEQVTALCRSASEQLRQLKTGEPERVRIEEGIDVAKDSVINTLRTRLEGRRVDLVINNAGILKAEQLGELNFATIRQQFEVNSLGPLRVTEALLPMMKTDAKVAIVTSRMGSLADNSSGSRYGYRMSKAAVNMAGISLSRDLQERGIAVVLLHPGFVRTEMTGGRGLVDAEQAATGLLQRIDDLTVDSSGKFFHMNGEELPW